MGLVIPRGIVYHNIRDDIYALIRSIYSRLDDINCINKFEIIFSNYIGRKHCLAFPFARTAIYYALKLKGFKPDSEIIMPPITIKAILDVVLDLKLKPVFVDLDPETLCFDAEQIRLSINPNTKAILITYLFGMVPNISEIISLCRKNNLYIIEDFSQCLNGRFKNKKVGSFGDIGIYSASSIKTLDTYGGGLLVCDDDELCKKLSHYKKTLLPPSRKLLVKKIVLNLLRNIATNRIIFHLITFPFLKLLKIYKPNNMMKHTGNRNIQMIDSLPDEWFKSYTSFQAREGMRILPNVEIMDKQRTDNVEFIKSAVNLTKFPGGGEGSKNVYWQLIAYADKPSAMQKFLQSRKIDTATTSLEKISTLAAYPYQGNTPNANRLYTNGLFIPAYPGLTESDLNHIVNMLNESELLPN